ncbi:MAG: hypothetical protein L0Z62_08390 [Gemmataceae bacterium]|nr:hypothetical protein [Gemmataceae bacterium]
MRHPHCTITPALVRRTARHALQQVLPWQDFGSRVTAGALLGLLLLVAALCSSLSAIARRFRFGFSHETARQALAANLPGLDQLTRGLVAALWIAKLRLETTVTLPARLGEILRSLTLPARLVLRGQSMMLK